MIQKKNSDNIYIYDHMKYILLTDSNNENNSDQSDPPPKTILRHHNKSYDIKLAIQDFDLKPQLLNMHLLTMNFKHLLIMCSFKPLYIKLYQHRYKLKYGYC